MTQTENDLPLFAFVTLYSNVVEFDSLSKQMKYKDWLKFSMQEPEQRSTVFSDHVETYGYAAIRAYKVYKDDAFLDLAVDAWSRGLVYIQDGMVNVAGQNAMVQTHCTATGKTAYNTSSHDIQLSAKQIGKFLSYVVWLSAELGKTTSNQTYFTYAKQAKDFILSRLYDDKAHNIQRFLSTDRCIRLKSPTLEDTAMVIEGFSILFTLQEPAIDFMILRDMVISAVSSREWHDSQGILHRVHNTGTDLPESYLLQGVLSFYGAGNVPNDFRAYIESYIGVQYNAVIHLARYNTSSSLYGMNWTGPAGNGNCSFESQVAALSPLIAGIALGEVDTSSYHSTIKVAPGVQTSIPSNVLTLTMSPWIPPEWVVIVVGSVLSGALFVSVVLVGVFLMLRRHRRKDRAQSSLHADPFLGEQSSRPSPRKAAHASSYISERPSSGELRTEDLPPPAYNQSVEQLEV
ncbi:glycoside hydrolase family 76 protein [Moniliophthora roreri MCA 2997]|uniref:Glycoside hydrolase family 76 protein n=1 Tax=Moniliophthora roreri (strain MCA 2997) TaxID=1381753 RepID=V2X9M3_MONRO|nr:glycoside hydrolase family 76 protein [Moniliophthora roreri MCA 2997]